MSARTDAYIQYLQSKRPASSGRQYEFVLLDKDHRQIGSFVLLTQEHADHINKTLPDGKEYVRLQRGP